MSAQIDVDSIAHNKPYIGKIIFIRNNDRHPKVKKINPTYLICLNKIYEPEP